MVIDNIFVLCPSNLSCRGKGGLNMIVLIGLLLILMWWLFSPKDTHLLNEQEINKLLEIKPNFSSTHYNSHSDLDRALSTCSETISTLTSKGVDKFRDNEKTLVRKVLKHLLDLEDSRKAINQSYIENELVKLASYFDTLEKFPLSYQQRVAIVTEEDNNLVIAGAGSGKSTTVLSKIKYIIENFNVKPEDILLLSFSNKSVSDLNSKITIPDLEAHTFHSFASSIIATVEDAKPSIADDNKTDQIFENAFKHYTEDTNKLKSITDFFLYHQNPTTSLLDFSSFKEKVLSLRNHNLKPFKMPGSKETFMKEKMKSFEEVQIANFLMKEF